MTVSELIEILQATEEMDKEILLGVNGEMYTIKNRLLGYEHHVDIIANKRYAGNDFFNFDNLYNKPDIIEKTGEH